MLRSPVVDITGGAAASKQVQPKKHTWRPHRAQRGPRSTEKGQEVLGMHPGCSKMRGSGIKARMEAIPEGALGATYVFHTHSLGKEILFLGHGKLDPVKIFGQNIDILCILAKFIQISNIGGKHLWSFWCGLPWNRKWRRRH